jgi:hypothetical protein
LAQRFAGAQSCQRGADHHDLSHVRAPPAQSSSKVVGADVVVALLHVAGAAQRTANNTASSLTTCTLLMRGSVTSDTNFVGTGTGEGAPASKDQQLRTNGRARWFGGVFVE